MDIQFRIATDLTEAQYARQEERVGVLRLLKSALKNGEIAKRPLPFSGDDAVKVLRVEVKKRLEAIELYAQGGRPELAAKEAAEVEVIRGYLPPEADPATVRAVVEAAIAATGASSAAKFGKVMGVAMKQLGSSVSGDQVSAVVRELLGK